MKDDWSNQETWHGYDWYSDGWQGDPGTVHTQAEQPSSDPQKTEQPVGSLVISVLMGEDFSNMCRFDLCLDDSVCLELARKESDDELQLLNTNGFGAYRCIAGLLQSVECELFDGLCFPRACRMFCDSFESYGFCDVFEPFVRTADLHLLPQVLNDRQQLLEPLHDLRLVSKCWHDCDGVSFHEGLVAPFPMRVKMFLSTVGTFLNHVSETSHAVECQKYSTLFAPLLSQLGLMDDCTWWLLDSGASVPVLSKSSFVVYSAEWSGDTDELDRFSAANGSSVNMLGKASVSVSLFLWDRDKDVDVWKKARLSTLVGETRHSILSATTLCKSGWIFKQDVNGASLIHESSGLHAHEVTIFAGCPWIRLHPHSGLDTRHDEWTLAGVDTLERGVVNPL